jgi:predicted GNAT family acetyltransferase
MEVQRYQSAAEFLLATKTFRSQDPIRVGLITSIATSVENGSRTYEDYYWWSVTSDGEVKGLAMRTVPYGYVLSPMPEIAIQTLYSVISENDVSAKEFAGPKTVIDFLEEISNAPIVEEESELIYQNNSLTPATSIGQIRTGTYEDFDLIFKWMQEFMKETSLRSFNLETMVRNTIESGRYSLLEISGTPVCLGGNSDIQRFEGISVARVGPIYTPIEHRKKGYASALTSHITAKLQSMGAVATLYTQADNPTSNKIYQEIGYTLVDQNRRIVFA